MHFRCFAEQLYLASARLRRFGHLLHVGTCLALASWVLTLLCNLFELRFSMALVTGMDTILVPARLPRIIAISYLRFLFAFMLRGTGHPRRVLLHRLHTLGCSVTVLSRFNIFMFLIYSRFMSWRPHQLISLRLRILFFTGFLCLFSFK
jgi:hypothetical protein